jgi:hypothetical protein
MDDKRRVSSSITAMLTQQFGLVNIQVEAFDKIGAVSGRQETLLFGNLNSGQAGINTQFAHY